MGEFCRQRHRPPRQHLGFPHPGHHALQQAGGRTCTQPPPRVRGGSLALMVGAGVPPSPSLASHHGHCRLFGVLLLFAEADSFSLCHTPPHNSAWGLPRVFWGGTHIYNHPGSSLGDFLYRSFRRLPTFLILVAPKKRARHSRGDKVPGVGGSDDGGGDGGVSLGGV